MERVLLPAVRRGQPVVGVRPWAAFVAPTPLPADQPETLSFFSLSVVSLQ